MESPQDSQCTWEERMYWKNFHFAHFLLTLPDDFQHHLKLPKKFSDYMRTNLPEKVVLKINGLNWYVSVDKKTDDVTFQGDGWEEFAKAYDLQKNDQLVFKYNRYDCFEVLMIIDGASSCEKEASYFVRKTDQPKCGADNSNPNSKANAREELTGNGRSNERVDDSNNGLRNKSRLDGVVRPQMNNVNGGCNTDKCQGGKKNGSGDATTSNRRRKLSRMTLKDYSSDEEFTKPSQGEDDSDDGAKSKHCKTNDGFKAEINNNPTENRPRTPGGVFYKSNRRPVSDHERAKALDIAKEISAKHHDPFTAVKEQRPTSVYKNFVLTIPKVWKPSEKLKNGEEVTLRVKDKTWVCTYSISVNDGGFCGGWRKFVVDNVLEESDVCVFIPVGRNYEKLMFDVRIIRVVPEVVRPTLVTP